MIGRAIEQVFYIVLAAIFSFPFGVVAMFFWNIALPELHIGYSQAVLLAFILALVSLIAAARNSVW